MSSGFVIDDELEIEYSPSKWVTREIPHEDVVSLFFKRGFDVRERLLQKYDCELNVVYGGGKSTKLDIYFPDNCDRKCSDLLIFVHGGYWQEGSKEMYAFLGEHFNTLGCILVMLGYDFAPHASMDEMVKQIENGFMFTASMFPSSRIFLTGHSAGAHLVSMLMTANFNNGNSLLERIKGLCLVSGIFDLQPILSTSVNLVIGMDRETALRNSPINKIKPGSLKIRCNVLVVVGEQDSPSFQEQSKVFHDLLKEELPHYDVKYLKIPDVDHFSIMEKCAEEDFLLNKALRSLVKGELLII
ncbi:kynurenine formamidase-like [Xenia sp. Carnegie-2017]|uniref:kynurenine formamidase-like n=1 Tax=Xenia sp. Carnegie-2017 TaxID=2897299 RepID=UPI001F046182|nr:kynurenine formamidase-like [Xenia sp. Carnegie-2017]